MVVVIILYCYHNTYYLLHNTFSPHPRSIMRSQRSGNSLLLAVK